MQDTMQDTMQDMVRELLAQSLLAWGLIGSVRRQGDGVIAVSCNATEIEVVPSPPGLPFRWMVTVNGRRRGAISLVAVLRQMRGALDPGYAINKVRIAALPPVPVPS
jgi:hypothetical protein